MLGALGTVICKNSKWWQETLDTPLRVEVYAVVCVAWCAMWCILRQTRRGNWLQYFEALYLAPVGAFLLALHASDYKWATQTSALISLIVLLIICVPSLIPYRSWKRYCEPDALGRGLLYNKLGQTIREVLLSKQNPQKGGRGITVAVTGAWGSGKSHFINYIVDNLVKTKLHDKKYPYSFGVAEVDVWKCRSVEDMWTEIAESLASAISEKDVRLHGRWGKAVLRLLDILHIPHASLAEDIFRIVTTGINGGSSVVASLNRKIETTDKAYILILDNLDRCKKQKLLAMLPLIERLKSISRLVTICGVAYDEMAEVDKEIEKVLDGTFLKIFDIVIPMPHIPKELVVPYMLLQLKNTGNKSEELKAWCENCSFLFSTPRLIENVIKRLALIETNFLAGRHTDSEHDKLMQDLSGKLSFEETVYTLESLRTLSPMLVLEMENMENPYEALNVFSEWYTSKGNKQKTEFASIWKDKKQVIARTPIIQSILQRLSKSDEENLTKALRQTYLGSHTLSEAECMLHFTEWEHQQDYKQALKKLAGCYIHDYEQAALFISIISFAVKHSYFSISPKVTQYCRELLSNLPNTQHTLQFSDFSYAWLLLEAYFTSTERSMQSSNQWKGLIDTQLLKIPIKWLREMIEALLEHRIEKHPVSELSKAPGLAQALMDSREHEINAQTRNAAQDVMKLVISIYGERVSQALINGVSNDKEKFNWIIGQSSPAKQYEEILRTRAKDYYETKVNSKDIASQQRIRANLLNALTIDAWQNNGNSIAPTIFCVLSFACIWDAIASYVFTTGQLTEEEKEKINLIRDECHPHVPRLAKTDTTSNEPSSIFEQNRQRAYHIIDDRLNRLLTDVNK